MKYQLRIAEEHYKSLQQHLFPGDGKEAVAIVLCGRFDTNDISILLTHKVELIPYEECIRTEDYVNWRTERIIPLLDEAAKNNMAILKIHCHPTGYAKFSKTDDISDKELFTSTFGWCNSNGVHASAVMLPNNEIFARVFNSDLESFTIDKISIVGDEIIMHTQLSSYTNDEFSKRTRQAFGDDTYHKLKQMKIGVIGCSGTGSPTIEQLTRLGVGTLVIVDPDKVEQKNLNRIINSTMKDAISEEFKTTTISKAIHNIGLGTKVIEFNCNLYDNKDALRELITCDVVFGCVDSVDGRHLISQLTNFYLIPYFDLGVRLDSDGKGNIVSIVASIHYIKPGYSTLLSRKLYTAERLFDDGLLRQDPNEFKKREEAGYVRNANVDRPAVISINMQISSMAINEFLNRIHSFKDEPPSCYAKVMMDYSAGCIENVPEKEFEPDSNAKKWTGRGDYKPFLRMTELQ